MKIQDESMGVNIEIEFPLNCTRFEISDYEMATLIGSFMGQHDLTCEQVVNWFLSQEMKINQVMNKYRRIKI